MFAPRGSRHTFQNVGKDRGRTIGTAVPGGLDLFFEELEQAAPRGATPDGVRLLAIFEKHGQEMLGPPLRARSAGGMLTARLPWARLRRATALVPPGVPREIW